MCLLIIKCLWPSRRISGALRSIDCASMEGGLANVVASFWFVVWSRKSGKAERNGTADGRREKAKIQETKTSRNIQTTSVCLTPADGEDCGVKWSFVYTYRLNDNYSEKMIVREDRAEACFSTVRGNRLQLLSKESRFVGNVYLGRARQLPVIWLRVR